MGRWRHDDRSDAELIRAAGREPEAFRALYARHVGAVHRWLARRIEWAASDLTAETFARAWLTRDRSSDGRDGSAFPWLLGIAGNLLADAARRDRIETRGLAGGGPAGGGPAGAVCASAASRAPNH